MNTIRGIFFGYQNRPQDFFQPSTPPAGFFFGHQHRPREFFRPLTAHAGIFPAINAERGRADGANTRRWKADGTKPVAIASPVSVRKRIILAYGPEGAAQSESELRGGSMAWQGS